MYYYKPKNKFIFRVLNVIFFLKGSHAVCWFVSPFSSERARRFRGVYHLHFQSRWVSQTRNRPTFRLLLSVFLLGLLLDPENGDDIIIRNFGMSPNYIGLQPKGPQSTQWEPQIQQTYFSLYDQERIRYILGTKFYRYLTLLPKQFSIVHHTMVVLFPCRYDWTAMKDGFRVSNLGT
jgi:hypothetical protein